jgi:hypothetical protein
MPDISHVQKKNELPVPMYPSESNIVHKGDVDPPETVPGMNDHEPTLSRFLA